MLLPDQMSRVLIVGANSRLEGTLDLLYEDGSTHIIDFIDGEDGFRIGKPLAQAIKASERLLTLRAIAKDLRIREELLEERYPLSKLSQEIDGNAIEKLENEISDIIEHRNQSQERLSDLQLNKRELEPFTHIPLSLDMYRGYESLAVFTGTVRVDPTPSLMAKVGQAEVIMGDDGHMVAVFVARKDAEETTRVLADAGFMEIAALRGEGLPSEMMIGIDEEMAQLEEQISSAETDLVGVREKHIGFLIATDEELSNQVDRAELPLRLGSTSHAFFIDAWVPTDEVEKLAKLLEDGTESNVHLEVLEVKDRTEHDHAEDEEDSRFNEAPINLRNGRMGSLFEYLVTLISRPKYNEVDPSSIFAWTFPFFFGFMVGDIGYAIPFIVLGAVGLKKCTSNEWRTISTMLFFGGLWAFFFGTFFFAEMLGIHFISTEGHLAWNTLLGINVTHDFALFPWETYSKLGDVEILLYFTCWLGFAHLMLGLMVGFYNVKLRHGLKHAVLEKGGWMLILLGGILGVLGIAYMILIETPYFLGTWALYAGIPVLLLGMVMLMKGEGGTALMELFGMMTNVLSYTRLAAIGMSKAGMAFAFNFIAIEMIGGSGGTVNLLLGLLVFLAGHMTIWMLAIVSAGLHSARLQYVEFFGKFFKGGGLPYSPLRMIREHTEKMEA